MSLKLLGSVTRFKFRKRRKNHGWMNTQYLSFRTSSGCVAHMALSNGRFPKHCVLVKVPCMHAGGKLKECHCASIVKLFFLQSQFSKSSLLFCGEIFYNIFLSQLRATIAPCIESVFLLDRLCYLHEQVHKQYERNFSRLL